MPQRFRFTKTKIAGLAPSEAGKYEVYDTDVPRLAARVYASGTKTFYVIKRADSSVAWLKLGTFPDMSVEQARKAAERALGEFAKGINPADQKRQERQKQALQQAFDVYFNEHIIGHEKKRADDVRAIWERFLGTLPDMPPKKHGRKRTKHPAGKDWSRRKLHAISHEEVQALHAAIGKTHKTMANRVLELISAIYNYVRAENPTKGIKPFKEKPRKRYLNQQDPDELLRFFTALAEDTSEDFKHFVLLSLLTGARRTNVLAMRWNELNLKAGTWTIPDTKNNESLDVALMPEAIEVLNARKPKAEGYVFPALSKTGHATPPKKRWSALLSRAQVSDLRIHDLRRSLGSWQAISGASLVIIGKSLGHKSPSATAIYAQLNLDPVRASLNTATSAMLEAAGVKKPGKVVKLKRV